MIKRIANDGFLVMALCLTTLIFGMVGIIVFADIKGIDALYWASTTMTTVGYGDVTPKTTGGKIFTICFQMWSIIIVLPLTIAWILGKVNSDLYSHNEQVDADNDRETIKADIQAIKDMLNER